MAEGIAAARADRQAVDGFPAYVDASNAARISDQLLVALNQRPTAPRGQRLAAVELAAQVRQPTG